MIFTNLFGRWLCRMFRRPSIGRRLVAHWPKENVYVIVEVSSVKFNTFTARFVGGEPDAVNPGAYGQCDNDVEYDMRTRRPVGRPDRF